MIQIERSDAECMVINLANMGEGVKLLLNGFTALIDSIEAGETSTEESNGNRLELVQVALAAFILASQSRLSQLTAVAQRINAVLDNPVELDSPPAILTRAFNICVTPGSPLKKTTIGEFENVDGNDPDPRKPVFFCEQCDCAVCREYRKVRDEEKTENATS